MYSSGEDLIKPRKPYTITKQRERWTEEEHNRFIEALKLHGRAWQRIEEHIGTKTAVQIRSHAQKFFTKLEKEAQVKGVPLKQTLDIDIPPPRPKKKPSNPYPRKTNGGTSQEESADGKLVKSTTVSYNNKQILDLETPPSEDGGTEKSIRAEALNEGDRSEVLTLFQEVPCTSMSTASKISPPSIGFTNRHAFKEFMPLMKDASNHGLSDEYESCATVERKANLKFDRSHANYKNLENSMSGISNLTLSTDKIQSDQDCPRQAPVHIVNVSSGIVHPEPIHQLGAAHGSSSLFSEPTVSAASQHHSNIPGTASHQLLPDSCPPLTSICNNQDTTQIFSNLIISTLLQNPTAHAAASLAASLWPCRNLAVPIDSPVGSIGGFPSSYMGPPQSMTAIAAATIAAASAWWAAHGVFPLCPPLHTGCMSVPSSITTAPAEIIQAPTVSNEMKETISHDSPRGGDDEALEVQGSDPKWSPPSLSESEESGDAVPESNPMKTKDLQQSPPLAEVVPESSKGKARGQVNRSSCGSNTPSSSELDTSGLDKQEKRKEDLTNPDANYPSGFDLNNQRNRFTGNINESWKEVSEEGRIAFQALFSREVLPQSFMRSNEARSKEELNNGEERHTKLSEKDEETKLQLGPSSKLSLGDGHGKLKGSYRTGFKPYKRCSSEEAKESRVMMNEEKGNKRIRLDGEVVASNS